MESFKNVENAKLFMNFVIQPENAAMISADARYGNGIVDSGKLMPADMKTAPEVKTPSDLARAGSPADACSPEVMKIDTKI